MSGFNLANGTTAINTILAEEANRIGSDIYSRTLHTSPWLDLTKQSAFADGMGYQQTTLVYDRAIVKKTENGTVVGANWGAVGNQFSSTSLPVGQSTTLHKTRKVVVELEMRTNVLSLSSTKSSSHIHWSVL